MNMVKQFTFITLVCWGHFILTSEAERMSPQLMKIKAKDLHTFTIKLKEAEKNINTACLETFTDEISNALSKWFPQFTRGVDKIHQDFITLKNQNSYAKLDTAEIKQLCDDLTYYYKFIVLWTNHLFYNDMQSVFKRSNPGNGSGLQALNQLKTYLTDAKRQTILNDITYIAQATSAKVTDRIVPDLHIKIKIFTPQGQTPSASSTPTPTPPKPAPAPSPAPAANKNPKFWNVSSKTIIVSSYNKSWHSQLNPGKLWKPIQIDKKGFWIECEGFKPIMILLEYIKTDIIAIDAGTYLFGSKIPEAKKIKYQYFTTAQAKQYALKNKLSAQYL